MSGAPLPPLGDRPEFKRWSSTPHAWGPDGSGQATFAGGEIDGLIDGIKSFPAEVQQRYPGKAEPRPVAVGCVPWFTSLPVAQALLDLRGGVLVVIDKSKQHTATTVNELLVSAGACFHQHHLPGLEFMGPADEEGRPPVVHPSSPGPGHRLIGPLRTVGWPKGTNGPILHAKILVLGAWWHWDDGEGEWAGVTPLKVWVGSANWSDGSPKHLEFGAWSRDKALAQAAFAFCEDLVRFSEPFDCTTRSPSPELVDGDWDDEAFYEAYLDLRDFFESDGPEADDV